MPKIAWWDYMELRNYPNMANYTGAFGTELSHFHQVELRRHYFAAISWIDSLIGKLLRRLDSLGLRNDTIISFIGQYFFSYSKISYVINILLIQTYIIL